MEKQIRYYYKINGNCPYIDWYNDLDKSMQLRVDKRIDKLKNGLYSDCKPLQKSELSELRMDFGKGYRIYYYDLDDIVILFVGGSDKKEQKQMIKQCNDYIQDFCERTGYDTNKTRN